MHASRKRHRQPLFARLSARARATQPITIASRLLVLNTALALGVWLRWSPDATGALVLVGIYLAALGFELLLYSLLRKVTVH